MKIKSVSFKSWNEYDKPYQVVARYEGSKGFKEYVFSSKSQALSKYVEFADQLLKNFTFWVDETETFHEALTPEALNEINKYGFVPFYKNDLDQSLTQEHLSFLDKEIKRRSVELRKEKVDLKEMTSIKFDLEETNSYGSSWVIMKDASYYNFDKATYEEVVANANEEFADETTIEKTLLTIAQTKKLKSGRIKLINIEAIADEDCVAYQNKVARGEDAR